VWSGLTSLPFANRRSVYTGQLRDFFLRLPSGLAGLHQPVSSHKRIIGSM
jgi:hypothetical protein